MEGLGAGLTGAGRAPNPTPLPPVHVRAATADDAEQIVALQRERNGDDCEPAVRALFEREDVGLRRFAVAVDDAGRVQSSLCLLPERLQIGAATVAAGQIEYVATDRSHERRGLVRRLMDLAHRWSAEDDDVVELIAGIPYFYRRFGYEYALPFPRIRLRTPGTGGSGAPSGLTVRDATIDDIAPLRRLQGEARTAADLSVVEGDERWWRWWIGHRQRPSWRVVVDSAERVVGAGTVSGGPPGVGGSVTVVGAPAGDAAALRVLLDDAGAVEERPGVTDALHPLTHRHPRRYSVYVRIGDPVAFLLALRPELDRRLAASPFAGATGELTVSTYTASFSVAFEHGTVTDVASSADPRTGTGVDAPPDRLATLLVGRHGATGLAEREDDVHLSPEAAVLADVLLPRLRSDVTLL